MLGNYQKESRIGRHGMMQRKESLSWSFSQLKKKARTLEGGGRRRGADHSHHALIHITTRCSSELFAHVSRARWALEEKTESSTHFVEMRERPCFRWAFCCCNLARQLFFDNAPRSIIVGLDQSSVPSIISALMDRTAVSQHPTTDGSAETRRGEKSNDVIRERINLSCHLVLWVDLL